MEEAARARAAALDALDEITPAPLNALIEERLEAATMTPGVLTLLAAAAADRPGDPVELDRRAAGVQLIYDGLALTRQLARGDPWATNGRSGAADLDILAADVLVARGFHLLARTEAASKAVETVRAFGREETDFANGTAGRPDGSLEADVFELAIIAGTTATSAEIPAGAGAFAVDLADSFDGDLPGPEGLITDATVTALTSLVSGREPSATALEGVWPRTGSSVTDP